MKPTLTWLDLTSTDRDRMRRVLDLFKERGTVDELGIGTLRDQLSDALFPGTSSIQTRLRYFLFIPWIYQTLEHQRVLAVHVAEQARDAELGLIAPLKASADNLGVIGSSAQQRLQRLPSETYWAGLLRWGLFVPQRSRAWYHHTFNRFSKTRPAHHRADDPGVVWTRPRSWNEHIPPPPNDFPHHATMAMRPQESALLRDLIQARCPNTALARLVSADAPPTGHFWDEPALRDRRDPLTATVELARRFSRHLEGAPLLYNLMLAEARHDLRGDPRDKDRADAYRAELTAWAALEAQEDPFDPDTLWRFMTQRGAKPARGQRPFIDAWARRITAHGPHNAADDDTLRQAVRFRETQLKTNRSRFTNPSRLLAWSGRVGVGRLQFRWHRVRQMMIDLHHGLEAP